ncbi:MAG: phage tail tape measure protein [Patescibacteria group bacterium]|nr:phage tail tape measure protein [Patescibacteria group bacterium]
MGERSKAPFNTINTGAQSIASQMDKTHVHVGNALTAMSGHFGTAASASHSLADNFASAMGGIKTTIHNIPVETSGLEKAILHMGITGGLSLHGLGSAFESVQTKLGNLGQGFLSAEHGIVASLGRIGGSATRGFGAVVQGAGHVVGGSIKAGGAIADMGVKAAMMGAKVLAGGAAVATAAGAIGGVTLKMAGDWQESMTQLVTGAGVSQDAIGGIGDSILKMAGDVGDTPDHLAQGMYYIASAGFAGADGTKVLEAAAKGAKIGMADQADTANALTSALNSYHLGAGDAAGVTGQLISIVANGKMHMQDLAGAYGTFGSTAAAANISIQESGAALATMTMKNGDAATSATHLRQMIAALEKPSKAASDAFKSIGLTSDEVGTSLTTKGLYPTLQLIQDHLDAKLPRGTAAANNALMTMFGGVRSGQGALDLMNNNLSIFGDKVKAVGTETEGASKFQESWAETSKDMNVQAAQVKGQLSAIGITIGTALMPVAGQLLGWINKLLPSLDQVKTIMKPVQDAMQTFASVLGQTHDPLLAVGSALEKLGVPGDKVAGMMKSIRDVANGVKSAIDHLGPIFDRVKGALSGALPFLSKFASGTDLLKGALAGGLGLAILGIVGALAGLVASAAPVIGVIAAVVIGATLLAKHFGQIKDGFDNVMSATAPLRSILGSLAHDALDAVIKAAKQLWDAIGPALQDVMRNLGPLADQAKSSFAQMAPIFGVVAAIIGALVGGAFKALTNVLSVIIPMAIHMAMNYVHIFLDVLNIMTTYISGVVKIVNDLIHGNWQQAWTDAKDMVSNIAKLIVDIFGRMLDNIKTVLQGGWDAIKGVVSGFVQGFLGFFQDLKDKLVGHSIVPDMVKAIIDWIKQLPGKLADALGNLASSVIAKFMELLTKIGDWELQAVAKARDIAAGIISGLVEGIKNGISEVTGAIGNMVGGALDGAKHLLGIHSPSKAFMDIGTATGQGFAQGITSSAKGAKSAAAEAAKQALLPFQEAVQNANNDLQQARNAYKEGASTVKDQWQPAIDQAVATLNQQKAALTDLKDQLANVRLAYADAEHALMDKFAPALDSTTGKLHTQTEQEYKTQLALLKQQYVPQIDALTQKIQAQNVVVHDQTDALKNDRLAFQDQAQQLKAQSQPAIDNMTASVQQNRFALQQAQDQVKSGSIPSYSAMSQQLNNGNTPAVQGLTNALQNGALPAMQSVTNHLQNSLAPQLLSNTSGIQAMTGHAGDLANQLQNSGNSSLRDSTLATAAGMAAIEIHLQRFPAEFSAVVASANQVTASLNSIPRQIDINIVTHHIDTGGGGGGPSNGIPARASGGPVQPNTVYAVGENGPELFVSDTAGTIIPHDRILPNLAPVGGGTQSAGNSVVIDLRGSQFFSDRDQRAMVDMVEQQLVTRLNLAGVRIRR